MAAGGSFATLAQHQVARETTPPRIRMDPLTDSEITATTPRDPRRDQVGAGAENAGDASDAPEEEV